MEYSEACGPAITSNVTATMSNRPAQQPGSSQSVAAAKTVHCKVLIVDDEPNMAWGVRLNLEAEGFEVAVGDSGAGAIQLHRSFQPDLILLDLKLPDIFGLDVLRKIRTIDPDVRVIIVSCLVQPEERVAGLRAGANDYQVKPFEIVELISRIRAQLDGAGTAAGRHAAEHDSSRPDGAHLILDATNRTVHFRSQIISLAEKPFALLSRLLAAAGQCVSREELLREIWHFQHVPDSHTLEQHVTTIRRVLRTDPDAPEVIVTVYGRGYRINPHVLT